MPKIVKTLLVPYTTQQMYDLINAVETYPQFLPWCKATEIHTRSEKTLQATMHLAKGPVNYSITTKNIMQPHSRIEMQYVDGPFSNCNGVWMFAEHDAKNSKIAFSMDYEFANKIQGFLIEPIFNPIANTLVDAFHARAQQIYGK